MNEKGVMLIDALLGLLVITVCSIIIIPTFMLMQKNAQLQLLKYRASEVMLHAANEITHEHTTNGSRSIDKEVFYWDFNGERLCVSFYYREELIENCVTSTTEVLP